MSQPRTLDEILKSENALAIEKAISLENAFKSNDVDAILRAQAYLQEQKGKDEGQIKSLLFDPMQLSATFGYKEKPYQLSFDMLRAMAKTHVIKAIKATRKAQVSSFCEPQRNKYDAGFIIDKKNRWRKNEREKPLTAAEQKKADTITDFILNCGTGENKWSSDTFEGFIGKLLNDSLDLDQATFEVVRNRKGELSEFFATDGATYRLADQQSYDERQRAEIAIDGYVPTYVQLYQGRIISEFYPWELNWGVRNPTTDIRAAGYGKSELEDMIQTVTSLLNSDTYNANFFRVGSSPKGILKYSGTINQNTLDDFRKQWIAQLSGTTNMHKIPIINADKMDFINTHVPNKDMEFSKFQEFLIKISCAIYIIDPSEINFPMSGSSDAKPMFEGNNEARLKYSRDKGLKPLLKWLQYWLNKMIVQEIDPEFELRFVGIDDTEEDNELDNDIKRLGNFMTINEIRAKNNLEPIPGGDIIANPMYMQSQQMAMMGNQQTNDAVEQDNNSEGNGGDDDNPFMKALQRDIGRILS